MRKTVRASLAFLTAIALGLPVAGAGAPAQGERTYLVGYREGFAMNLRLAGVRSQREWLALNVAKVETNAAGVAALRAQGGVAFIEEDRVVRVAGHTSPVPAGETTWGLDAVHATDVWPTTMGDSIRVCVLDTGIDYSHPEFSRDGGSVIKGSANFIADGHPDASDGHGHGTHVAGTIAAAIDGAGVAGVAPNVHLYVARVLDDQGYGTTSTVLDGLAWCSQTVQAHIASLSLGSIMGSLAEDRAFAEAYRQGMLSVAASGNESDRRVIYPAAYRTVMAIGAIDSGLALASFSNYGFDQELVAPGVDVRSAVPVGTGRAVTLTVADAAYSANALEFAGTGHVAGPLVECGLATTADSCAGAPSDVPWVALISRGSITFAEKVSTVMAQGASAAIITNNDAANPNDYGDFTLATDGAWIPVVSISYHDGAAIRAGGLTAAAVTSAPSNYASWGGTSMATPHVAGVAALLWAANPTLSNAQVRQILRHTAMDLGAAGRDTRFGYGLVQADAAVNAATP